MTRTASLPGLVRLPLAVAVAAFALAPLCADAGVIEGHIVLSNPGPGSSPSVAGGNSGTNSGGGGNLSADAAPSTPAASPETADIHGYGPENKWGDPLSQDFFENGDLRASLKYYAAAGRNGSQQAVGINISILSN